MLSSLHPPVRVQFLKIDTTDRRVFCGRSVCQTYCIYFTMLVFDFSGVKLSCDLSFFAVLALFFYFDNGSGICAFLGCIFHELGHLIVMTICGVQVNRIFLYGGGIRLTSALESSSWRVKLAVSCAGCMANIVLSVVAYLCEAYIVSAVNLLLAAVNLLPFGKLDGARIAELIFIRSVSPERVEEQLKQVKMIFVVIAAFMLLFVGVLPDITLLVFGGYLLFLDKIHDVG